MAREIFSGGVHGNIDTVAKGFEKERSAPGVIQDRGDAVFSGYCGNGWNILHLKGEGPWGLQKYYPSLWLNQGLYACSHEWIVIIYRDIHTCEILVAE